MDNEVPRGYGPPRRRPGVLLRDVRAQRMRAPSAKPLTRPRARVRPSRAHAVSDVSQAIAAIAAAVAAVGATVAAAGAVGALSDPPERACRHVVHERAPASPEAVFKALDRLRALEDVKEALDRLRVQVLPDP